MAEDEKKEQESLSPEEKLFKAIVREQKETDEFFDDESGGDGGDDNDDTEEIDGGMLDWWRDIQKTISTFVSKRLKGIGGGLPVKKKVPVIGLKSSQPDWMLKVAAVVGLRALNKIMMALVIALVIYLIMDIIFGAFTPSSFVESGPVGAGQEFSVLPKFPEGGIRPLSYYEINADARNAFFPEVKKEVPVAQNDEPEAEPEIVEEPPKNYKIMGISWDAEEYVAFLQDEEGGTMQFVKKGDEMESGVEVKDVTEFSVTLSQGGQQWELQ